MAVAIPLRSGARSQSEGALTAALYKQHAGELLRFAWHRLGRLEDAEDAVQATFLSAHRVLAEGERVREPRAWLFRILRNECLTRMAMTKRRGVHEELGEWHADLGPSVADQMESNDEFDIAVALLATLPEQQREAMVLREWLGMSAIETADVLDVTPQGVDALVYRARKALVGLTDVEAESTCGTVRLALADAKINSKIRAHLLACRSCRSAARRLHAPEEMAAANGFLPLDAVASRLGESIPGFALAGGAVAAAGGGAAAAGIASSLAAGTAAKVIATVAVGAIVATGAVREAPAIRDALAPASNMQALPTAPQNVASADGSKRIVSSAAAGTASVSAPAAGSSSAPAQPGGNASAGSLASVSTPPSRGVSQEDGGPVAPPADPAAGEDGQPAGNGDDRAPESGTAPAWGWSPDVRPSHRWQSPDDGSQPGDAGDEHRKPNRGSNASTLVPAAPVVTAPSPWRWSEDKPKRSSETGSNATPDATAPVTAPAASGGYERGSGQRHRDAGQRSQGSDGQQGNAGERPQGSGRHQQDVGNDD
jgi:RNA polymerase sigma factor (sigma-70 family)